MSLACTSFAQGGGGGQGGGRGFGAGMGQRMGGMVLRYDPMTYLGRTDVEKDLGLTDEQVKKLEEQNTKNMEKMRARFQPGGNTSGENLTMEERMKQFDKQREADLKEQQKTLEGILKPEQMTRVKEIWAQLESNRVILYVDMQKELAITDKQKEEIKALQTKQQEANQALMEKTRNQEITREDAQASREKNNKIMDEQLGKLLTTEQTDKIKVLKGTKTFTPDKEVTYKFGGRGGMMGGGQRGNRGGGGGGNRGGGGGGGIGG